MCIHNQKCTTQSTPTNLHPNEHTQGLCCFYPFVVNLDRCVRSCNTLNDLIRYMFQMKQKI